jgi:hypothetical protein
MYKPKHLKPWVEFINYSGDNFDDYWIAHMRFFRCTPAERSNHRYINEHLKDCGDDTGIEHATFTDSVMMLRYYTLIHESNERALRMADMFAERISRKGSLDPELEAQMNERAVDNRWKKSTIPTRVQYCQEAGVSIFAARRNEVPKSDLLTEIVGDL